MLKIQDYCLDKFDESSENHQYAIKKIKDYRFDTNFEILKEISGNENLCEFNITKLVVGGTSLAIRCSNGYSMMCYLIDCFNVYKKTISSSVYEKDIELTKKWRRIMKETYPDSDYVEDARNFIQQEKQELIQTINLEFNDQIQNL